MKTEKIKESILGGRTSLGIELGSTRIKGILVDENNEVIGYKFINLGAMMKKIKSGTPHEKAFEESTGTYGRYNEAVKYIDPRNE